MKRLPISSQNLVFYRSQALPLDAQSMRVGGPVAQLGERLHGMEEVAGSIPVGSTNSLFLCLLSASLLCLSSAFAAPRQEAVIHTDYQGADPTAYATQYDRVRLLVKQAQLEVSSKLGLIQYQEGFQYPLTIVFQDGAPTGLESALAYVQLQSNGDGFRQQLVVNVPAAAQSGMDFDTVFTHEMTHAVMNDAVGGQASLRIPHWVQEGLAQYVSGEGEGRIKKAASQTSWDNLSILLWDLDSPYTGAAYPQYYLNIRFILEHGSINALQGFIRNLIDGKSVADSLKDTLFMDIPQYQHALRSYSLRAFQDACNRGAYHNLPCQ